MLTIVDGCPLSVPGKATLSDGSQVALHAGQAIVWMSVTARNVVILPTDWPRFPAVLDTGFNGNLLISERQLRNWARIDVADLVPLLPETMVRRRVGQQPVTSYQATLWLHRIDPANPAGVGPLPPVALYPSGGVLVLPPSLAESRLPLIGTELLRSCGLRLVLEPTPIDPWQQTFDLRFSLHSLLES
jgi:hypothetical protein